jgi:hypothetical protein
MMKCGYRGRIIDATPDFSFGKYFAHARLIRVRADDEVDGEMHIERSGSGRPVSILHTRVRHDDDLDSYG